MNRTKHGVGDDDDGFDDDDDDGVVVVDGVHGHALSADGSE